MRKSINSDLIQRCLDPNYKIISFEYNTKKPNGDNIVAKTINEVITDKTSKIAIISNNVYFIENYVNSISSGKYIFHMYPDMESFNDEYITTKTNDIPKIIIIDTMSVDNDTIFAKAKWFIDNSSVEKLFLVGNMQFGSRLKYIPSISFDVKPNSKTMTTIRDKHSNSFQTFKFE